MTAEIRHSIVPANGIALHVAECGEGPLVLLCHGWPELWYSWRHQLRALGAAGFRAVAPDMRGFGRSTAPDEVAAYTILHHTGDMVALVQALGETRAVIVGHDWGANVAWNAALMRPDLFSAIVAMSVPHRPRNPAAPPLSLLLRCEKRPPLRPGDVFGVGAHVTRELRADVGHDAMGARAHAHQAAADRYRSGSLTRRTLAGWRPKRNRTLYSAPVRNSV
jgi:pimeloyl-ACP methyl ester carboxylesterase